MRDSYKIIITREGRERGGKIDLTGRLISREASRENREPFKYAVPLSRADMPMTSDPIRMQICGVARRRSY